MENKFKMSEINYKLFVKRFGLVSQMFVERLTVNHILGFPCPTRYSFRQLYILHFAYKCAAWDALLSMMCK